MTRIQYKEALARVESGNPGEVLLPLLRSGWSEKNVIYMKAALRRLDGTPAPTAPRKVDVSGAGDVLASLYKVQQVLRGRRAKLSNSFHDCKTDADRREVSAGILKIEEEIRDNERKIAHYKAHRQLPQEAGGEGESLPDDPIALMKALASINAKISQTKKTLLELGRLPDNDPERAKIQKYEAKLARLKLEKGHAEQKIKAIQSAGV
jgi:hypothetical protein